MLEGVGAVAQARILNSRNEIGAARCKLFPHRPTAPPVSEHVHHIENGLMVRIDKCECGTLVPTEDRTPCLNCGSTVRRIELSVFSVIRLQASLAAKAKSSGVRKPFYEWFGGAHWASRFQKFMQKISLIDRRTDWYREEVRDPDSGKMIHSCSERLSDHSGHGSAKNN